jgi:serine/threonine protein phosphatase PrpC
MTNMTELVLDVHLITDRGLTRERNEDRCGAFSPEDPAARLERGRLYIVADGMGGHAGGDVAAELTVQTLPMAYFQAEWSDPRANLRSAFISANAIISEKAANEPGRQGMGAAAVAAVVVDGRAVLAHLGDCRAYRLRGDTIERLTVDHSWVEERVTLGRITHEEALIHPYRNVLTRALGAETDAEPTVGEVDFQPGDVLLLCSDGLWNMVKDDELAATLRELPDARSAARALVDQALDRGGTDNISVAIVRALPAGTPLPAESQYEVPTEQLPRMASPDESSAAFGGQP